MGYNNSFFVDTTKAEENEHRDKRQRVNGVANNGILDDDDASDDDNDDDDSFDDEPVIDGGKFSGQK